MQVKATNTCRSCPKTRLIPSRTRQVRRREADRSERKTEHEETMGRKGLRKETSWLQSTRVNDKRRVQSDDNRGP